MADDELTRLREMATSLIEQGVDKWKVNYTILIGLSDGIQSKGKGLKCSSKVMARKLCSLYMHNDGYSYPVIAKTIGLSSHGTAMYHANTCRDFLRDDVFGDKCYKLAHRKAQELGIAR